MKNQICFLFLIVVICGCGAGGSTPQVSLLPPVSGLISISTPTPAGLIRIQGVAGAVDAGTTIAINDTDAGSTTATAAGDGSFSVDLAGSVADNLELTYTINGTTDTFGHTVTNNNILVTNVIETVTTSSTLDLGFAHSLDGTHSYIDVFDLSNGFASSTPIQVDNFRFSDAAFNDTNSKFYLVSAVSNEVALVDPNGNIDGDTYVNTVHNPIKVAVDQGEAYGLVGYLTFGGSTESVGIIHDNNGAAPTVDGIISISHPTAGTYIETYEIEIDSDASTRKAVALSRYTVADGTDTIVSLLNITLPNTITVAAQFNLRNAVWSGDDVSSPYVEAVLFNDGTEIVVTDREESQIIRLAVTGGNTITESTRLDANFGAFGIVYDNAIQSVFVTNSNDHSLSQISMATNTTTETYTTADGMGLIPGSVAIDHSPLCVMTQNETSATVSFICPD